MAQIHRFHDKVAIHVDSGQTVYLDPGKATAIGKALTLCAEDVDACDFLESQFTTWNIEENET